MSLQRLNSACFTDEDLARFCFDNAASDAAARETMLRHVDECAMCRELWLAAAAASPTQPSQVGRFELRTWLGNGGMGDVFVAYDPDLQREVALKLLRSDDAAIERVLHEARAMARVVHPNVVAVYEAGSDGERPFIAMELVRGVSALVWQNEAQSYQRIIEMYLQFGRGLAAAHQAGIVHCDFKPHNALVTDDGVGKVSDFGLASAHDAPTTTRQGTQAYMAPEQLAGAAATPASDQYAFAVSLWEALWQQRPQRDAAGALPHPSTNSVPEAVYRVVARALEPTPAQRYPGMAALLLALEHAAAAPQRQRRRRQIASVVAVAALATGGAGYALHRSADAPPPCRDAAAKLAGTWDEATRTALRTSVMQSPLSNRSEIADRLVAAFDGYSSAWTALRTQTCEATRVHHVQSTALLDRKIECLDGHLLDVRALAQIFIAGRNYSANDQQFVALLNRSIEASQKLPPLAQCETATTDKTPAALSTVDRERIANIRALATAGLFEPAKTQSAAALATPHDAMVRAELQFVHAEASEQLGQFADVATEYQAAAREAARVGADELRSRIWLAYAYFIGHTQAKPSEGLQLLTVADEAILRAQDPPALRAQWLNYQGTALLDAGKVTEAIVSYEQALVTARTAFGANDVKLAPFCNNYGTALRIAGKVDAAAEQLQLAVTMRKRALGEHHIDVATSLMNLGHVRMLQGQAEVALTLQNEALAIRTAVLGPTHSDVAASLVSIGVVQRTLGKLDLAAAAYDQAVTIWTAALGADHPNVALALNNVGAVKTKQGQFADARRALDASLQIRLAKYGADHTAVASTRQNLGELELAQGNAAAAMPQFNEALRIRTAALGAEHADVSYPLWGRGSAELLLGKRAAAVEDLQHAARIAAGDPAHRAAIDAALARAQGPKP